MLQIVLSRMTKTSTLKPNVTFLHCHMRLPKETDRIFNSSKTEHKYNSYRLTIIIIRGMSNARFIYKLLKHSGDHADMIVYTRSVWKTNYPSPGMVKERYIYSSKKKKKKKS